MVCDLYFNKSHAISLKCIIHYAPMFSVRVSKSNYGGGRCAIENLNIGHLAQQ